MLVARSDSEADVRTAIRGWLGILASGDYGAAAAVLAPVGAVVYTAGTLKEAICRYSRRYREATTDSEREASAPRVSDPTTLDQRGERLTVYPRGPSGSFIIEYLVPLDGVWSDLTAIFDATPTNDGVVLGLYDLRVM